MKDDKYPEPPELRKAGVPPLLKIIKIIVIANSNSLYNCSDLLYCFQIKQRINNY